MEKQEFNTEKGWITLPKNDLDELRAGITAEYKRMDGAKPLGASSKEIYQELAVLFKTKFQQLGITIRVKGQEHLLPSAGYTFLKHLFYTKKDSANQRAQQYNFDACYVYAFGETRATYKAKRKGKGKTIVITPDLNTPKVIISSFSSYGAEVEKIQKYLETNFGFAVQKDLRDVNLLSVGSLIKLYNAVPANTTIIHLIGKEHFCSEKCVGELNHLRKECKEEFLQNTSVLFLQDISAGEYDVNGSTGRHKINQWWLDQIKFMKDEAEPRSKDYYSEQVKEQKVVLDRMEESKQKILLIISDMDALIEFFIQETRLLPFQYFMNSSTRDEVTKWLKSA